MTDEMSICLSVAVGFVIGALLTRRYLNEQKKQKPIDESSIPPEDVLISTKTAYIDGSDLKGFMQKESFDVRTSFTKEKPNIMEYTEVLKRQQYNVFETAKKEEQKTELLEDPIRVVSPDEYGSNEEYEIISLTYYADHILTGDDDREIKEVEDIIGEDALGCFGQYEDDSVFVVNDNHKAYYEILLDPRTYSDVLKTKKYILNDDE